MRRTLTLLFLLACLFALLLSLSGRDLSAAGFFPLSERMTAALLEKESARMIFGAASGGGGVLL